MDDSTANPYQAPATSARTASPAAGPPTTAVTFRLTAEDLRRFESANQSRVFLYFHFTLAGAAVLLAAVVVVARVRQQGFTLSSLAPFSQIGLGLVLGLGILAWSWSRGRRSLDASPETTVTLSPEGLSVSQAGVGSSTRSWRSIAEIKADHHQIVFWLEDLHPTTGRYIRTGAQIIPLLAFPSPESAASFLCSARSWHSGARTLAD